MITSRLLGCFAATVLWCTASLPVMAETATPGSVDPPTTTEAPVTSGTMPETQVKKSKVRHRHARYRHRYRHYGFFFPPPRYWFHSGWSRHRYYRHRRHYSGFPFFWHFRW